MNGYRSRLLAALGSFLVCGIVSVFLYPLRLERRKNEILASAQIGSALRAIGGRGARGIVPGYGGKGARLVAGTCVCQWSLPSGGTDGLPRGCGPINPVRDTA